MFFIVNKTKAPVSISDLDNLVLGPRQAIDLDKLMDRSKSESSKMLRAATREGKIDIRIQDGGSPKNFPAAPTANNDLDDMKNELLQQMKDLLATKEAPAQPVQQAGIGKEEMAEFAQQIIQNMPKPEVITVQGQAQEQEVRDDEEVEVSDEMLSKIGERAINKITEGAEIESIDCKEEKQDSSIMDNINELENLL